MARRYVATLTSIPPRFDQIGATLDSLLNQSIPPDAVILYLSRRYDRFPDHDGRLPDVPEGVEIRLVDHDFGPATKVLPAVQDFAGEDVELFFCDDDQIYPRHTLKRLLKLRKRFPDAALTACGLNISADVAPVRTNVLRPRGVYRWRVTNLPFQLHLLCRWSHARITGRPLIEPNRRTTLLSGYMDWFEAYMGVLVRPGFFPPEVFDIPDFARPVDDVWLSGHLMRNGHPVWVDRWCPIPQPQAAHTAGSALHRSSFGGKPREVSNAEVVRYFRDTYGIWT